jgi:hypothetical protein
MKPYRDSGDHVLTILLVSDKSCQCWNEGDKTAQEVGKGAFEDAAASVGIGEVPEGVPFVANILDASCGSRRAIVGCVGAEQRC